MKAIFLLLASVIIRVHPFSGFERIVEARILSKNPGIKAARLKIKASRLAFLFLGRIKLLQVDFFDLEIGPMKIKRYTTLMEDFRFSPIATFFRGRLVVNHVGNLRWWIHLHEKGLEHFLQTRGGVLNGARVSICPDGIWIRRPAPIISILSRNARISVLGAVRIRGDADISLDFQEAEILSTGIRPFVRALAALLNPILTSSKLDQIVNNLEIEGFEKLKSHVIIHRMRLGSENAWIEGRSIHSPRETATVGK